MTYFLRLLGLLRLVDLVILFDTDTEWSIRIKRAIPGDRGFWAWRYWNVRKVILNSDGTVSGAVYVKRWEDL